MILCKHDINWYIHRTIELCTWFHRCMKKIEKKFHASNVLEKTLRKTYYDSSLRVHVSDLVLLFSAWVKRHGTLQVSGPVGIWEAQPACEQFYLHVNRRPACEWVLPGCEYPTYKGLALPACEWSGLYVSGPGWMWVPCLHENGPAYMGVYMCAYHWSCLLASGPTCMRVPSYLGVALSA